MTQTGGWSPRFRWQLPFFVSACLGSAATFLRYVPFGPLPLKLGLALLVFGVALAALLYAVVNVPRDRRLMRVPMTPREMRVMMPLYALTAGLLTARVVLLLQ